MAIAAACSSISPDVIAALVVGLNGAILEYLRRTKQQVRAVQVQVSKTPSSNGARGLPR